MNMDMKDEICKAFCGGLTVRRVPAGLAIGTPYDGLGGDPIGFFVVGPDSIGKYHIQDDGLSVSTLEAYGADLENKSRSEAFNGLLLEYDVSYDEESGELTTTAISPPQIPAAALRFSAFLLRVQDLLFMSQERAASTFREDAMRTLSAMLVNRATIVEDYVIDESLKDFPADIAILLDTQTPVAVFFGSSDARVSEALLLHAYASQADVKCKVIALLETENSVSKRTRQRASNRLAAFPHYRGDEIAACARIAREVLGYEPNTQVH